MAQVFPFEAIIGIMVSIGIAMALRCAQGDDGQLKTHYESSEYLETGRYQEAVQFVRTLAKKSPFAHVLNFGTTPEGRPMVAVVVSPEYRFKAEDIRKSHLPLIFVQNGIHAGEIEGKDASLILMREMLLEGKYPELMKGANWIFVPVFNVDGHERFGPYHRINQNGPAKMGWRATAQNLNLNRDYMKADAPETRSLLGLIHRFQPDFFFDNHTTDGADYRYSVMLGVPSGPVLPDATVQFQRNLYQSVEAADDAKGFLTAPYFDLENSLDPSRGIVVDDFSARFSNGYMSALQRPSMLVETHMLKPYWHRVDATRYVLINTARYLVAHAAQLKQLNVLADRPIKPGDPVVLDVSLATTTRPFIFKGWKPRPYKSEISGALTPAWEHESLDTPAPVQDSYAPSVVVNAPLAYAIPPQWTEVISRLHTHGQTILKMKADRQLVVESSELSGVKFDSNPFEGRFMPHYKIITSTSAVVIPAGTILVPATRLAMHLLEPAAPDSLVRWGFFNNIFETKEYFEDYSMEPIARRMKELHPEMAAQFQLRLKDPSFATNPRARLQWWFDRSPYHDDRLNQYPVLRVLPSN